MSFVNGLQCRECGKAYPKEPLSVCEFCFGPLEVVYDYEAIRPLLRREVIRNRAPNMWRYAELLPLDGEARVGSQVGFTPLVRAGNLGRKVGPEGALHQERQRLCTNLVLQGSGGGRGPFQGAGIRLRHGGLRLDRKPCQLGGCQRRQRRTQQLRCSSPPTSRWVRFWAR